MRRLGLALAIMLAVAACSNATRDSSATTTAMVTAMVTATPASGDPGAATTTFIPQTTVQLATTTTVSDLPARDGATTVHLRQGPFDIQPGQNNIDLVRSVPQPDMNGWIVGIRPNLTFDDGTVPRVDVVHLHHGVWLNASNRDASAPLLERFFAAGEEKTAMALPEPYGYRYLTSDRWVLNYMLHNLTEERHQVWITYDIDIIADTAPQAAAMTPAHPVWMDVQNGQAYPVFDALKGSGDGVTFTYPDQATDPYKSGPALNTWTSDRDGVLIQTAGHLHPGGLHTDLWLTRDGDKAHLFRSDAKYYEPAGAVSWDVSMTATTPQWHVQLRKGDILSTTATYDSGLASWYESMGIMVTWIGEPGGPADDPFTTTVDGPGMLTHGHLPENDNHGGQDDPTYRDLTTLPSTLAKPNVAIADWTYAQGDMIIGESVPAVKPGGTITFTNEDAGLFNGVWHTITSCQAPCNKSTGIAYPLADGPAIFDSGELGLGGPPTANRITWTTPSDLPEGTYTYFCRIHPVMRGAFRIEA